MPAEVELAQLKDFLLSYLYQQFPDMSKEEFEMAWGMLEQSGQLVELFEEKAEDELSRKTLKELEAMVTDKKDMEGLTLNNRLAMEMIKRTGFNRNLVNKCYNGLGVEVHLGREGAYGEGQQLKKKLNLQQFYTHEKVSEIAREMLKIPIDGRVFDPSCGSGRLFWGMPNERMCHGIEIESAAFKIAKALYPTAQIIQDDMMLHMHEDTFDYVIANPPYSLSLPDTNRLFKFVGYRDKMVSDIACMEIACRSLKDGGYFVVVLPMDVWHNKVMDKIDFVRWWKDNMSPVAKIALPTRTHEGTVYPTALYVFKKEHTLRGTREKHVDTSEPKYEFEFSLVSFEPSEIQRLLNDFSPTDATECALQFANDIRVQEPFVMKPEKAKVFELLKYLKSAIEVVSKDVVQLDAPKELILETFIPPPINLIPNGLHADLKTRAIRAIYGTGWSPARRAHIDIFAEYIAKMDLFLNDRKTFDQQPLISDLHKYDCGVELTEQFKSGMDARKNWLDIQDVPFEIWTDDEGKGTWNLQFANEGYRVKYPELWASWKAKLDVLEADPAYLIDLKGFGKPGVMGNWFAQLFEFQKNDVLRLAIKASTIHAGQMGLGKTMSAIAAAILKGYEHNLFVCPTRLIKVWLDEFEKIGMKDKVFVVEYNDDLPEMGKYKFVIASYDSLKAKKDRRRPKGKKKPNPNGDEDDIEYNPDYRTSEDFEADMAEMAYHYGYTEDDIDAMLLAEQMERGGEASHNPEDEDEDEDEEEDEEEVDDEDMTAVEMQVLKLAKMEMFTDNLAGKFDFVVVDEAHSMQNPMTKLTQSVMRLRPKQWCLLTGTPIKNRVKGLLSLIVTGWGEETRCQPYSKKTFLETFTQTKEITYEYVDSHGFTRTGEKEIEVPQIANPDLLRSLMTSKWLRRTKYEPDVAAERKFPMPNIITTNIKPSEEEQVYAKQWYDEYSRLRKEIMAAKRELGGLKGRQYRTEEERIAIEKLQKELKTKIAIGVIMIGKLRAVALAPQIEWLGEITEEAIKEKKYTSALQQLVKIPHKYKGGLTPRQEWLIDEIVKRVKAGEQLYTIVQFPAVNDFLLPHLKEKGVRCDVIKGGTWKRNYEIIDKFKKKELDVILATIGTFDVGINIPDAQGCIIVHPQWNWADVSQAFSRMIRPQSKGERTVDILILGNSIEVYVEQLMDMKKYNTEYVLDYGVRPPETPWLSWQDAVAAMFKDIDGGKFHV